MWRVSAGRRSVKEGGRLATTLTSPALCTRHFYREPPTTARALDGASSLPLERAQPGKQDSGSDINNAPALVG